MVRCSAWKTEVSLLRHGRDARSGPWWRERSRRERPLPGQRRSVGSLACPPTPACARCSLGRHHHLVWKTRWGQTTHSSPPSPAPATGDGVTGVTGAVALHLTSRVHSALFPALGAAVGEPTHSSANRHGTYSVCRSRNAALHDLILKFRLLPSLPPTPTPEARWRPGGSLSLCCPWDPSVSVPARAKLTLQTGGGGGTPAHGAGEPGRGRGA